MKKTEDALLFEVFGKDAQIPKSTKARMEHMCAQLKSVPQKAYHRPVKAAAISRRALLVAVIIIIAAIFAGTVLAYGLIHTQFFNSIFGTGISGNEDERTYYDQNGEQQEYPLNERVELNEAAAEYAVGECVSHIEEQFDILSYSYTIHDFLVDENGMGYVSYTIDCEAGFDELLNVYSGQHVNPFLRTNDNGELCGIALPHLTNNKGIRCNGDTFIIDDSSTDTHAYLVYAYRFNEPLAKGITFTMTIETYGLGIPNITINLPVASFLAAKRFISADERHVVELSAVGMTVECRDHAEHQCCTNDITISCKDGDYSVKSEANGVLNIIGSTSWGTSVAEDVEQPCEYNTVSYLFNRLVILEDVLYVEIDGVTYLSCD